MNKILLKLYLRTGNKEKIRDLSNEEFRKLFYSLSLKDKIVLAQLRGDYKIIESNLDNIDLMINGRGLYELLDDQNSLLFYLVLLDYINKNVKDNGEFKKRFNVSSWDNKLDDSGYLNFSMGGIYDLIDKNSAYFISLLENDESFRKMFFDNVNFEGNLYELKIDKILCNKDIASYLAGQKEMEKFYNKRCSSMFYGIDESFFTYLPDEYKYLIGYHVKPNVGINSKVNEKYYNRIKSILHSYFYTYLSSEEIDDLLSLYESDVTYDNIASLISFIVSDHSYYKKYKFLLDNYFDGDISNTISFCRKYNGTSLFNDICNNNMPDIKEKIIFLAFANRLKGVDSLKSIKNLSLAELRKVEDDLSECKEVKEDVRVFGNNDIVSIKYDREIIVIYPDGSVDEREVYMSHDQAIYSLIKENGYSYEGIFDLRQMIITITSMGNILIIIEGDYLGCTLPNNMNEVQKESLKELFARVNKESNIELAYQEDSEIYVLNGGLSMDSESASEELSRIKIKSR